MTRNVQRTGDMSRDVKLKLYIQEDGDIVVAINGGGQLARVEFCQCGIGGGQSPNTLRALRNLFEAMEKDNCPQNTQNNTKKESIMTRNEMRKHLISLYEEMKDECYCTDFDESEIDEHGNPPVGCGYEWIALHLPRLAEIIDALE